MMFLNNKDNLKVLGSTMVLIVAEYFILGPLELYAGNRNELLFNWADFLYLFLIVGGLCFFIGGGIVLCMPEKIQDFINYGLFSFGIASYIQALLFNKSIVNINGGGIEFGIQETVFNAIIWILIFFGVFMILRLLKNKNKVIIGVCLFLTTIQLVASMSILITNFDDCKFTKHAEALDNRKQYMISNNHNIIVLILDTFGNELFDEALETDDDWKDTLKDFDYYRNVCSGYAASFPALMYAFSGEELYYGEDTDGYFKEAWDRSYQKMWKPLDELGYERRLYTGEDIRVTFGDYSNMKKSIDNITDIPVSINKRSILKYLGFYSAYKYLPIILKPYFSLETGLLSSIYVYKAGYEFRLFNYEFYKGLKEGIQIENTNCNLFSINHIVGVHADTMTSISDREDCSQNINEKIHDNYVILEEYLSQLKKLDKYDDSDIIIMADHGSSDYYDRMDYQPIFLVKKRNQKRDKMNVVKEGHISYSNFSNIVVSLAENKNDLELLVRNDDFEEFFCKRVNLDNMPHVKGSAYNSYYKWLYNGNRERLKKMVQYESPEVLPASEWSNGL